MRLLVIFLLLAFAVLISFALWGGTLEAYFTQQGRYNGWQMMEAGPGL